MFEHYASQILNVASHCILTFMLLTGCVKQAGPGVPDSLSDSPSGPDSAGDMAVFTAAKLPAGIQLTAVSKDEIAVRTQFQISDLFSYTGSFELSEEVWVYKDNSMVRRFRLDCLTERSGSFSFRAGWTV